MPVTRRCVVQTKGLSAARQPEAVLMLRIVLTRTTSPPCDELEQGDGGWVENVHLGLVSNLLRLREDLQISHSTLKQQAEMIPEQDRSINIFKNRTSLVEVLLLKLRFALSEPRATSYATKFIQILYYSNILSSKTCGLLSLHSQLIKYYVRCASLLT